MDIYCLICNEPYEMDSLHDQVTERYPDKPWLVKDKPEVEHEPDTFSDWCCEPIDFRPCGKKEPEHKNLSHPFAPLIFHSYKSWNQNPWRGDDSVLWHDEKIYSQLYEAVSREFRTTGCAVFGVPHNKYTTASPAVGLIYELLGDDLDGAASMMEDLGIE